jgi:hypothetical protein
MSAPIKLTVASLVLVALMATGCGSGRVSGISTGGTTWTVAAEEPVAGIHKGAIEVITLKLGSPNGVTVVVWCAGANGASSHGSTGPVSAFAEGHLQLPDETRVAFRCETDNGTSAKVTIDGREFETSKGSLFLISPQSEEMQIKQLAANVRDFPNEGVAIKDYALDNPEISAFFKDAVNNASADLAP